MKDAGILLNGCWTSLRYPLIDRLSHSSARSASGPGTNGQPVSPAVVSCVAIYSVVVCPLGFSRVVMGDSGFDGFNLLGKLGSLGTAWRLLG